ncbi:MAG: FAD-binding protein [Planctomycetes bacterium]|nr:FAD-binding protein [Planctomycetota bacterium]
MTPATELGVIDVLRAAVATGERVRISGGGASARVSPGPTADRTSDVTCSTLGLRGVVALRPSDLVMTVRAGTSLVAIDAALREVGCVLPLNPWDADDQGTVGGAVAAAADGVTARNGYRWRDILLGARIALPTGDMVQVGASVVKSVAGFDVPKALCGSHGELGVITCLDIRIETIPEATRSVCFRQILGLDVARLVVHIDRLPIAPCGLIVTAAGPGDVYDVDARFSGRAAAVSATVKRLLATAIGDCRASVEEDAPGRWSELTQRAAERPPNGLHRRVAALRRAEPVARSGAQLSGSWVGDVLRGRATWVDSAPPSPPDVLTAALYDRVRRSFDPPGVLRRRALAGANT